ncbi:hypothetical protein [Pediococcus claussenii]|uniref:SAM-dependent methyltransferase n=1 Tax=Pediococcus claussenii (strain ATCC BAA-344 / DSM 14800 / JCM 18046 / KCTC 3811 / LMG 21948 / P06) TaxID=701521 RepID=G8PF27_PEDCP|nr:hypothetical protein [Pediococcus claussenii]AEV95706.1 putative SAM-dependent methyltransferase [Pediococcus claussenii ATCC BAA-344]ANZ69215.1 SAM-dependent methyltransferase [Pediococcus claussenii]ANZ71034.1 SAM-dependent methyltransferase [Pediococcus claussenii]
MNPKQLKRIKKNLKQKNNKPNYIQRMNSYRELFSEFPQIIFLVNHVLESDRLLSRGLLPQPLPLLELPENIQDTIFESVTQQYPIGDPQGDQLWDKYSRELPKLDQLLRSYRDYLEEHYGMWCYISAPFVDKLANYIDGKPVLEVMAGNGYISKGLRDKGQTVIATDSLDWTKENETGRNLVTEIERLDAIKAIKKYGNQVAFVIMSWSPDGLSIDQDILKNIRDTNPGIKLICIGERNGATNSAEFWQMAQYVDENEAETLNKYHQPFDLIQDQVYIIK